MNSYLSSSEISALGLKSYGSNIKISRHSTLYNRHLISLGSNVRIDDFCILSGQIDLGDYCHLAPHTIFSGATDSTISVDNFCTFAYGVRIFSKTDNYLGDGMTGSVVPAALVNPFSCSITIGKHVVIGTSSTVFPGIILAEGTSIGAMSLVHKDTQPWTVYAGVPAREIRPRSREPLILSQTINN